MGKKDLTLLPKESQDIHGIHGFQGLQGLQTLGSGGNLSAGLPTTVLVPSQNFLSTLTGRPTV